MIKGAVNASKWPCKVILATTEAEKYSGMAVFSYFKKILNNSNFLKKREVIWALC